MAVKRFLAFDLGSENGRALLGSFSDGALGLSEAMSFKTSVLKMGGLYKWNVYHSCEKLKAAICACAGGLDSVGVDAWGFDFGMLDERGQLITLPNHPRERDVSLADGLLDELIGNRRLYELTGIPANFPGSTAAQLIDLVRRNDIAVREGRRLLFIGDILNYFLTGSAACELTMAKSSGLVDINTNQWSGEIFDVFEIPDRLMSDLVPPGTRIGKLNSFVREAAGITGSVPVIAPASLSSVSASLAVPCVSGTPAFLNVGAQAVCGVEIEKPMLSDIAYAHSLINISGVGSNLLLSHCTGLSIIGGCKAEWKKTRPELHYRQILDEARRARPFMGIIDVDSPMFQMRFDMPGQVASFVERTGQDAVDREDMGVIARIVYESLALRYRRAFEELKRASFKSFDTVYVVGRGARVSLLCQFIANALNVRVVAGPVEATSAGNLLVQAMALGELNRDDMRQCAARSFKVEEYEPVCHEIWTVQYERYLDMCRQNREN